MTTMSAPLRLTPEDKLDALRHLDHAGPWQSLEDQRYCLRCGHIIDGKQIEVVGGTRPLGPLRLECPTPDCAATPNEWVLPVPKAKRGLRRRSKSAANGASQEKTRGWWGRAAVSATHYVADIATDCRTVLRRLRPFERPRFIAVQ